MISTQPINLQSPLITQSFLCDAHADTLRNCALRNQPFTGDKNHLTWENMQQGSLNLQFMAAFVPPHSKGKKAKQEALTIFKEGISLCQNLDGLSLVQSQRDLDELTSNLKHGFLLTLEGADPLMGSLEIFEMFHQQGLRSIGLTHNHDSCAASGCGNSQPVKGLTSYGRSLLKQMSLKGVLWDTAHLSYKAFYEGLEHYDGPIINSHVACAQIVEMERNITDEQAKLIAQTGGVIGVTYVPRFLKVGSEYADSSDVIRHIEHLVELVGIDHIALGSDFDGIPITPDDLPDPTGLPNLLNPLLKKGWSQKDCKKLIGGNWHRVLKQHLPLD